MSENPLLPHKRLRELHALMLRCRQLDRRFRQQQGFAREALLAATSIHLQPGDLLWGEPGDVALQQLGPTPTATDGEEVSGDDPLLIKNASRLPLCAAAARGLQAAKANGVLATFVTTHAPQAGHSEALTWAVERRLPLLLVCNESDRPRSRSVKSASANPPLNWPAMSRLAKRIRLPLFAVDGEDAVAVYRVMQEAVLRAREGGGPSCLWAVLGAEAGGRPQPPVTRLRRYMEARDIPFTGEPQPPVH